MDKVFFIYLISKISLQKKENTLGLMEEFTKACGFEIKCMEREGFFGLMDADMKAIIIWIKEKVMAFMNGFLILITKNSNKCVYLFFRPDGKKYIGFWKDGQQHGIGIMVLEGGMKIDGEWKNGQQIH